MEMSLSNLSWQRLGKWAWFQTEELRFAQSSVFEKKDCDTIKNVYKIKFTPGLQLHKISQEYQNCENLIWSTN